MGTELHFFYICSLAPISALVYFLVAGLGSESSQEFRSVNSLSWSFCGVYNSSWPSIFFLTPPLEIPNTIESLAVHICICFSYVLAGGSQRKVILGSCLQD